MLVCDHIVMRNQSKQCIDLSSRQNVVSHIPIVATNKLTETKDKISYKISDITGSFHDMYILCSIFVLVATVLSTKQLTKSLDGSSLLRPKFIPIYKAFDLLCVFRRLLENF